MSDIASALAAMGIPTVPAPAQGARLRETGEGQALTPTTLPRPAQAAERPIERDRRTQQDNARREGTVEHPQHEPAAAVQR